MPTATIGTQNDDVLTGTAGDDVIEDRWGDDTINGGDGNDTIIDEGGSNTIQGGGGDDFIRLISTTYAATVYDGVMRANLIDAGDGADIVEVRNYGQQNLAINLGSGLDLLTFTTIGWGVNATVATGAGADRIVLGAEAGDALRSLDTSPIVITDFTAGAGGDILDLRAAIEKLLAWNPHAENPFASGHLLLIQDGDDVIVKVDIDGAAGPGSSEWYDRELFRLENVNAAQLTAYNFAGYAPGGGDLVRSIVNGTSASEWLNADAGGSEVNGLGGNDRLTGGYGNDVLDGGIGNDTLNGGYGDDVIRGGDGDDVLLDPSGSDTFDGGAGNDTIDLFRPSGVGHTAPVTVLAGDGDDFVRFQSHDTVSLTVDLGAGNDRFEIVRHVETLHLSLGAGQDRVAFDQMYLSNAGDHPAAMVISDFTAGNSGDVLELDRIVFGDGWDGTTNPFTTGHLRLEQAGGDTLVIFDYDGSGGSAPQYTIARLVGVSAPSLTAFNFGGYNPNGSASSFSVIAGTSANDHIYGSNGSDVINGGDGNDIIEDRKSGSDTLIGGAGDDTIIVNRYDAFIPGSKVVTIDAGTGRDTVELGLSSSQLSVDLGADDDRVIVHGLYEVPTSITLGSGADVIELSQSSASNGNWALTITDFQTGNGGDRLDWAQYAEQKAFNGEADYNPFYDGSARLVQVGSDVQLQIESGHLSGEQSTLFITVMTFKNTNDAAFTAYNLGYEPFHPTASGGAGDDALTGTAGLDVLHGNSGNDQLSGLDGDDLLWGQDGADTLNGGLGADLLLGHAGNDILIGGAGADRLDGGNGTDNVDGGDGDDLIHDWQGLDTIVGGAGNDKINVSLGHDSAAPVFGSLSAGDGNDVVTLKNAYIRDGYAIDLGVGDDTLRLNNATGPVTLGEGRDTIEWSASYNINGTLVVADFATGDTGDIFDLYSFLASPLNLHSGEFPAGYNPFAAGHLELRQVGSEVQILFHRQGYNEVQYPEFVVVRFLNANMSALTAANFGGFDPHIDRNWTTVLHDDLTIGANDAREAVNVTAVDGLSPAFMFGFGVNADLVNHGTVTSLVDSLYPAGSATGFYIGPAPGGGSFLNASDGEVHVRSEWLDISGDVSFGSTYGIFAPAYGSAVSFQNDGLFDVIAASGRTFGVYSGVSPFINNGTLTVHSPYEAYGYYSNNSPNFANTGQIIVHGGEYAEGVHLGDITSSGFNNAGTITVTTDPESDYGSIGVYLGGRTGVAAYHHYNSGTITADIAIYADAWLRTGPDAYEIVDYLHNSGTINGAVLLAAGNDVIINTGTMTGLTLLEDGDDKYDGTGGLHFGTVEGGLGNDILSGGAFEDWLFGDSGQDALVGAGGADLLDGGSGNDTISGGASADTLTGGIGDDSFTDSATGLNGDTITDFVAGDKIVISNASLASFTFSLSGSTLTYSGGSLTLTGFSGQLQASAAAGGGVQLTVGTTPTYDPRSDFNGDGRSDILWRNDSGMMTDWLGAANGGFTYNDANARHDVSTDWQIAGVGDFNGDNRDDILWRRDSGMITNWLGAANGGFTYNDANARNDVSTDWQIAGVGDFNGDNRDDILWRRDNGQMTNWLGQANGGFSYNDANALNQIATDWQIAAVGDFNGDNRDDILWRRDSGMITNWLGAGNGGFIYNDANARNDVSTDWQIAGVGDFNGDGRDDILWRRDNGQMTNWLGSANGGFTYNDANALNQIATDWHIAAIGDYNGDRRDDILWRNDSGQMTNWLGTASGGFTYNDANARNLIATDWHIQAPDILWV